MPEDFLELVDNNQQILVRRTALARRLDQTKAGAAQSFEARRFHSQSLVESGPQLIHGVGPGPERRDAPPRSPFTQIAAVERWHQARADQRRLSAARQADDRHESMFVQTAQQVESLIVSAKKQVLVDLVERAQARIGIRHGDCGLAHPAVSGARALSLDSTRRTTSCFQSVAPRITGRSSLVLSEGSGRREQT